MTTMPKRTIGRYELIQRLGLGGMAEVWLARQKSFGGFERLVALKRILPRFALDRSFVERFATEAHLAASLSHPHIVQIHDLEETNGELLMAMELVRGETLQAIFRRAWELTGQPIPPALAAGIIARVCRALHYAHTHADLSGAPRGIVHRDVAPSNVLVGFRGEVKVVDFGIARALSGPTAGTGGKVAYMAPEQARGEPVDARSDVFSAGVVLWELLTGMRLFVGLEAAETRRLVASPEPVRSAADARPGLDARLVAITQRALAKDPAARYADAAQLADALAAWGREVGEIASDEALAVLMGRLFRDRLELWMTPEQSSPSPAPPPEQASIFGHVSDVGEAAPRPFASLIEPLPELPAGVPVDPTDPDDVPAHAPPEPPPAPVVIAPPEPPPAPVVVAPPEPPPAPIVVAPTEPPPAPLVIAPPPRIVASEAAVVAKPATVAARATRARRPFRAPAGTSGHLLAMVGGILFLLGSIALPWQHFELADLFVTGLELNVAGIVMTALGGSTLFAAMWGLVSGRRHAAARYHVGVATVLASWLVVAATQLSWGKTLMAYESVSLQVGFLVAALGVVTLLGGALAVFGALPRWDASTSFLRLRLARAGRPVQELVVYEPRMVDPAVDLANDPAVDPGFARLPRFRVTREGDTSVALRDPTSRVVLAGAELDALAFNTTSRRGPGGQRWTTIHIGERGQVDVGDTSVAFEFVRPVPGRAHVRLTTWTESAAFVVLAALLFMSAGLYSIIAWDVDPERPPIDRDRRTSRFELVYKDDKPAEDQPREVQVDIETPKAPEPEVALPEERYGDDERQVELPEVKRPTKVSERVATVRDASDTASENPRDELMRRLLGPGEGTGQKLAAITAIDSGGEIRGNLLSALDTLPSELPGLGGDGSGRPGPPGPTGPLAGDAADVVAKKLTNPPKVAGAVRGKVTGMKSATKVTGQLDPGKVYSVIDGSIAKIQACYESRLQVDPSLAGRITFRWTVTPTGSVTGVQQHVSTIADPKVATCIKGVLERLRFPKPEGGSVEISYPFIFRSS